MKIVVIEDNIEEVNGYLSIFDFYKWEYERFRTFSEAYTWLAEEQQEVDLFWVDIMLPWGEKVEDRISEKVSWQRAGLYLMYAIRSVENNILEEIRTKSNLPKLPDCYKDVPIIALTKVSVVKEELSAVSKTYPVAKLIGLDTRNLGSFISEICGKKGE